MLYICLNCEETFQRPTLIREAHGELHQVSPCCLDAYMRAMQCAGCDTYLAPGQDAHGLCRKCAEAAVERLTQYLEEAFSEAEREVLNDAFDGVALTEPWEAKVVIP